MLQCRRKLENISALISIVQNTSLLSIQKKEEYTIQKSFILDINTSRMYYFTP